jgi:hypothetical protein
MTCMLPLCLCVLIIDEHLPNFFPMKVNRTIQMSQAQRDKLNQLPVRAYLDETVVPVMMQALAAVSRERPEDPVDYVAKYMLQHNPRRVADASRSTY